MPVAIGVDLGQSKDPSAIAVCETGAAMFNLSGQRLPMIVEVTHLERITLGTSYSQVRDRIEKLAQVLHFLDPEIVLDRGGPGAPVADDLRARGVQRVVAVAATGGHTSTKTKAGPNRSEDWNCSKGILLGTLSELVYSHRLRVSPALQEAKQFKTELQDLEHRVSDAGRETFVVGGDGTHHADLLSAVSLACWRLLRPKPQGGFFKLDLQRR